MNKNLKYSWLIEENNISHSCPYDGCQETEMKAYRWTFQEISNPDNFLPKKIFDRNRGFTPRQNSTDDKFHCSCCAISMFNSLEAAIKVFKAIPERARTLLGYTHVAEGELDGNDGKVSQIDQKGHFDLFEYDGIELKEKFVIVRDLS